jgi:glycosyltransferase involved in cell wall biosynthesis
MKLTIAIPTYNRANRLDKALVDLLRLINDSDSKGQLSVLVSNNGSLDNTDTVIAQNGSLFEKDGIPFNAINFKQNQGFDANVLACYKESNADYVWFLSDDDNVMVGVIDSVVRDLDEHEPTVIFYNHDQKPYNKENPYIKISEFFELVTLENLTSLKKIIAWPKLSALVVKKTETGSKVLDCKSYFGHVGLAIQCGLTEGKVLHSPVFTAYPDLDYQENIDFPPYISNNLNIIIRHALLVSDKMYLYDQLKVKNLDPLPSSLNTLGAFYRGKHTLTPALRDELLHTVRRELKTIKLNRITNWNLYKETFKFIISIIYGLCGKILTGKKLMRIRPNNNS